MTTVKGNREGSFIKRMFLSTNSLSLHLHDFLKMYLTSLKETSYKMHKVDLIVEGLMLESGAECCLMIGHSQADLCLKGGNL